MQLKRWNQKNGAYAIAVHNPLNKKYFIIKALSIVLKSNAESLAWSVQNIYEW